MGTFAQWVKQQEGRQDGIGYFARYWSQVTPGKISSVDGTKRVLDRIRAQGGGEREEAAIEAALSGWNLAVREYHRDQAARNAADNGLEVVRVPGPPETYSGNVLPPDQQPPERADGAPETVSTADLARAHERALADFSSGDSNVHPAVSGPQRYELADEGGKPQIRAVQTEPGKTASHPEGAGDGRTSGVVTVTHLPPGGLPETRIEAIEKRLVRVHGLATAISAKLDAILDALYPEPTDWDALYRAADHSRDNTESH